jgi:hypothetical protein
MKELLKELIEAESTPEKGELGAAEVISAELRRSGIHSAIDRWDSTRANIVAHVKSTGSRAALLFACHLDVVGPGEAAWKHPPFGAVESNGRIYGRGSVDMKGPTAAILSTTSWDHSPMIGGLAYNMKFNTSLFRSPKGFDSHSKRERGVAKTGSGSDRQNRTKPPASGGRKTGSPDC